MKKIIDFSGFSVFRFFGFSDGSKRGSGLLPNEIVRTILAVVVVGILLLLLFEILSPSFNEADKTAKSYFGTFEKVVESADAGEVASFFMMDNGKDDLNFYLVYFGGAVSFEDQELGKSFRHKGDLGSNVVCVCSEKESNVVCGYCKDLGKGVNFNGVVGEGGTWVVGEGEKVFVNGGAEYGFSV